MAQNRTFDSSNHWRLGALDSGNHYFFCCGMGTAAENFCYQHKYSVQMVGNFVMNDQWKRSALTQVATNWGARLVGLEAERGCCCCCCCCGGGGGGGGGVSSSSHGWTCPTESSLWEVKERISRERGTGDEIHFLWGEALHLSDLSLEKKVRKTVKQSNIHLLPEAPEANVW